MQCEHISYRFGIYMCEIKKEEKPRTCMLCSKFVKTHLYEHNINENKYKQNKQ